MLCLGMGSLIGCNRSFESGIRLDGLKGCLALTVKQVRSSLPKHANRVGYGFRDSEERRIEGTILPPELDRGVILDNAGVQAIYCTITELFRDLFAHERDLVPQRFVTAAEHVPGRR